jgi:hypothetical protein
MRRKLSRVEELRSCAEHGGRNRNDHLIDAADGKRLTGEITAAGEPHSLAAGTLDPLEERSDATGDVVTGDAGALRDGSARGVGAHFPAGAHVGVTGPDGAGCELDAVEHEVRHGAQQVFVLGAAGFALGAVGDDVRRPGRGRDGCELTGRREPSAASPCESGVRDGAMIREGSRRGLGPCLALVEVRPWDQVGTTPHAP